MICTVFTAVVPAPVISVRCVFSFFLVVLVETRPLYMKCVAAVTFAWRLSRTRHQVRVMARDVCAACVPSDRDIHAPAMAVGALTKHGPQVPDLNSAERWHAGIARSMV